MKGYLFDGNVPSRLRFAPKLPIIPLSTKLAYGDSIVISVHGFLGTNESRGQMPTPVGREQRAGPNRTRSGAKARVSNEQKRKNMNAKMTFRPGQRSTEQILEQARQDEAKHHYAAAFEGFALAFALKPTKESSALRAAENLLEIGRVSDAERFLKKVRSPPLEKRWYVELVHGKLFMARHRPRDAEKHFRKAAKLHHASTAPSVFLADCLIQQEKLEEAERILRKALHANGDIDEVFLNLGLVKRAQGDHRRAKQYLLKALEISPDYPSARKVLADVEACLVFGAATSNSRSRRQLRGKATAKGATN